ILSHVPKFLGFLPVEREPITLSMLQERAGLLIEGARRRALRGERVESEEMMQQAIELLDAWRQDDRFEKDRPVLIFDQGRAVAIDVEQRLLAAARGQTLTQPSSELDARLGAVIARVEASVREGADRAVAAGVQQTPTTTTATASAGAVW